MIFLPKYHNQTPIPQPLSFNSKELCSKTQYHHCYIHYAFCKLCFLGVAMIKALHYQAHDATFDKPMPSFGQTDSIHKQNSKHHGLLSIVALSKVIFAKCTIRIRVSFCQEYIAEFLHAVVEHCKATLHE